MNTVLILFVALCCLCLTASKPINLSSNQAAHDSARKTIPVNSRQMATLKNCIYTTEATLPLDFVGRANDDCIPTTTTMDLPLDFVG